MPAPSSGFRVTASYIPPFKLPECAKTPAILKQMKNITKNNVLEIEKLIAAFYSKLTQSVTKHVFSRQVVVLLRQISLSIRSIHTVSIIKEINIFFK